MTSTNLSTALARAVRHLRPILGDRLVRPEDPGFEAARRVWNAAVATRPALLARCRTAEEVRATVLAGRDCGFPVSVRGGGHDFAGRALRDGGLVIDLTGMRRVRIDPGGRTATVDGGATIGDLTAAGRPYGLVTATGVVRAVGLAGLTLAGGYGPLLGRYGLALDNLLGAELVLADGRLVAAGPDADAELYWAIRGGGGNFGVLTNLVYRLHVRPSVLSGMILFPFAQAAAVLRGYQEIISQAPDDATVMAGFLPGPSGEPVVFVCPFWTGAPTAGGAFVERLRDLGDPVLNLVAPGPYHDALSLFDSGMQPGNHYLLGTRWLPALPDAAVEVLIDAVRRMSSPRSVIALHHFHGAATRVGAADTAFRLRVPHLLVEVIAAWPPEAAGPAHREWVEHTVYRLGAGALPGGYPNLLAPAQVERAWLGYGGNRDRLTAAKRRYDPDNVFASVIPALGR
jgi:hypothetical protein